MKTLQLFGLLTLAAAALHGQIYYTPVADGAPDCSDAEGIIDITNGSETTIGYSCYDAGTFVWFAAGGPANNPWGTQILVSAPATNPIEADYLFYDTNGNDVSVDYTIGNSATVQSGNEVTVPLYANQPLQVNVLGATSNPGHTNTQTGSVYATFYCPDEVTCSDYVNPQLVYSALPFIPWSLSVPISWDDIDPWTTFYAEGIDDGAAHKVSFVLYNQGPTATAFNIYVYDSTGTLAAQGATPTIAGFSATTGEAGTYGNLLSSVVSPKLPTGVFKVVFDGGINGYESSVEVLQFTGTSATALNVWFDASPSSLSTDSAAATRVTAGTAPAARTWASFRSTHPAHAPRVRPVVGAAPSK